MSHKVLRLLFLFNFLLGVLLLPTHSAEAQWVPVGPYGGDARRFAADPSNPKHIYLGTTSGWLYDSEDGGANWRRVAKLADERNFVLDSIIVDASDPRTILVGAWVFNGSDGALFLSHDSGKTWRRIKDMEGQSIRALEQARSDPKTWVAGTLSGVYRSQDGGEHWTLISPPGSTELHEVESIAIDPADPRTIFAGTWHLPWKTTDGGANWHTIKQGLIDDSDVFSIILDPRQPATMYASACSGIYKSQNAGELFRKIQGIPATARRTRVLMQDPVTASTVYAGTTEGLYQTADAGDKWARLTGPDVTVNDVYIDSRDPKHVLMATDRSGVLMSDDAGVTFHDSNAGFSQRQVAALLTDASKPHVIYAGVLNDKSYGGVFVSEDEGLEWRQQSAGLGGLDVFSLGQAPDGTLFAGTSHGIYRWTGVLWEQSGNVVRTEVETRSVAASSRSGKSKHGGRSPAVRKVSKTVNLPPVPLDLRVNGLDLRGSVWYAATSGGIYSSRDQGVSWQGGSMEEHTGTDEAAQTRPEAAPSPPATPPVEIAASTSKPDSTPTPSPDSAPAPTSASGSSPNSSYAAPYWVSGPFAKVPPSKAKVAPAKKGRPAAAATTVAAKAKPAAPALANAAIKYLPAADYRLIDASGSVIYAASRQGLARSADQGMTWRAVSPGPLTSVEALATTPSGDVWIGGREGVFYSRDRGESWIQIEKLPMTGISGLTYDPELQRIVATSWQSTVVFAIDPASKTWKWWEAGWNVRAVRYSGGRLLGASRFDGVVMQPQTEASASPHGR